MFSIFVCFKLYYMEITIMNNEEHFHNYLRSCCLSNFNPSLLDNEKYLFSKLLQSFSLENLNFSRNSIEIKTYDSLFNDSKETLKVLYRYEE